MNPEAIARQLHDAGDLRPWRITQALNAAGQYGPEVDEACGAEEPAVDEWEAGKRYPTFVQVVRLAVLTGYPVLFFYCDGPDHEGATVFMCDRQRPSKSQVFQIPPRIQHYDLDVVRATIGTE